MESSLNENSFVFALLGGATAGLSVDLALFPLDTIKTRLQSYKGFLKSGGFKGIYSGIGSVALGSAPGAAIFFIIYETGKELINPLVSPQYAFLSHMSAAVVGELGACVIRVPVEVIKQRTQTNRDQLSSFKVLKRTLSSERFVGLYRGFNSTIIREVPFSLIQFPLWELFKSSWSRFDNNCEEGVKPLQSAVCGAFAGAISAGVTTPLDVAKTRIMLAGKNTEAAKGNVFQVLKDVYAESGWRGLFKGLTPRVVWISIGGFVFLGVYDKVKSLTKKYVH